MSGIDDLNFEDLVDGAINTIDDADIDDAKTERFEAKKLLQPKLRTESKPPILGSKVSGKRVQVQTDETIEMLDDTARMTDPPGGNPPDIPAKATSGNTTFDHIYMRAGVQPQEFTVFRVEELFNDDDLADLDEKGRLAAVRAVLKSHDVEFEIIVEDAVARRAALDAHDQRLKSNIQRVEREMEKENAKLQTEIEEYANPRIERMEKNNERVDRLRRDYQDWFSRKQDEQNRIVGILEPWGGDDRLRATEKVDAIHGATTVPTDSVSGDEAFEPQSEADLSESSAQVDAPKPVDDSVLADAGADQWDFDSEPSEGLEEKVSTELPSEYEPAAPVGATGEFDFQGPLMRIPRTVVQWLFTLFVLVLSLPVMLLFAAQLDTQAAEAALFIGFFAPILFAVVPTVLTYKSENFWTGGVMWWFVGVLIALGVAHYDPAKLTTNLTKRPLWFIDEAGLNAQTEEAVFAFTGAYAEAVAPLLGTQAALWKPEAKADADADAPAEDGNAAATE